MSIIKLFTIFLLLSAGSIGGGYALVSMLENYLIKNGLMDEREFYTTLSKAQSIPGPVAFTIALLVGKKFRGFPGALASGIAVILPPFVSILLLFLILDIFKNNIYLVKFLKGVYGALLGLIGGVLFKMIRNQGWSLYKVLLFGFAFFSILFHHEFLFFIFGIVIIINYFYIYK